MAMLWLSAVVMVAIALVLVLRPLLRPRRRASIDRRAANVTIFRERRDELEQSRRDGGLTDAEFEAARTELERDLLAETEEHPDRGPPASTGSPVVAIVVALAIPSLALGLYLQLGTPAAVRAPAANDPATRAPSLEQMVAGLEARLRNEPGNIEGWLMLARSYTALERIPEARDAFRRAYGIDPDNPDVILGLAVASARVNGNNLTGEPETLIHKALRLDPNKAYGLWLAGFAARQRGDDAQALAHWKRLLSIDGVTGRERTQVEGFVAQIEASGTVAPETKSETKPAAPARLSVRVSLTPELAALAEPTDTLFVYARAARGPRVPLAIVRRQAKDLPLAITLDDSMAMQSGFELSRFPEVVVAARISKSGDATPSPGDLEGSSPASIGNQDGPVSVSIDRILP